MIHVTVLGREVVLLYTWLWYARENKCKDWILLGNRQGEQERCRVGKLNFGGANDLVLIFIKTSTPCRYRFCQL